MEKAKGWLIFSMALVTAQDEEELQEWLVSPEGKVATLFNLTSLSRWGEMARS